jgi:hypothetical protein
MAGQKPVIGMNIRFSPDSAETVSPAKGFEMQNPVDQLHSAAWQTKGFGQPYAVKIRAEASNKITLP